MERYAPKARSPQDTVWLFRRCAPDLGTFAHAIAVSRGRERDWWALSWLRATEVAINVVWSRSPAFTNRSHRVMLVAAGAANIL